MADKRHEEPDEEKAKLILENKELKKARLVAERRAQDTERENTLLKERLSRTEDALANERREHQLLQGLFAGSRQGGEELGNAHQLIQSLHEDKQTLIASVESKESTITDLRQAVRDLRNLKTELETSSRNERMANVRVEKLKNMCDNFFVQVTGLISQIQESEIEKSSLRQEIYAQVIGLISQVQESEIEKSSLGQEICRLRQEINRLREEIDMLLVTRECTPFALHLQ